MAKTNEFLKILRDQPPTEPRTRSDDFVLAPYENAVSEIIDLIDKLDAPVGDSVMNELKVKILNAEDIPASSVAMLLELIEKDLLRIKHRLERSNEEFRLKQRAKNTDSTGNAAPK